jgi:hypothetical protein
MAEEPKKRPRRVPLSSEDIAHVIAVKRWREFKKREKLKKSRLFKVLNLFNIACFFIYFELLFCFFGPCNYTVHYSYKVTPKYGDTYLKTGEPIIADINVHGVDGIIYNFVIDDFIKVPPKHMRFLIGKDYLLQKNLKGILENSGAEYRLFSASPVLFLCVFVTVISLFAFIYNLNENAYSLNALTVLNFLTFSGILFM